MSTKKTVTATMMVTFGLTMLLTSGSGALAALSYSLLTSGLVGLFTLAVKESSPAWYSSYWPRRSFWSSGSSYYSRSRPFMMDSPAPVIVTVPSDPVVVVAPAPMPLGGRPALFTPATPFPPAPPPSYLPSHGVPASAAHTSSTFRPAAGRAPVPPASASHAQHVSSHFVPAAGHHAAPAHHATPAHSSSHGPSGGTLVSSTFRPANVVPSAPPSSGATHVSRQFRPAK